MDGTYGARQAFADRSLLLAAPLPREITHVPATGAIQASSCKDESTAIAVHVFPWLCAARPRQGDGEPGAALGAQHLPAHRNPKITEL